MNSHSTFGRKRKHSGDGSVHDYSISGRQQTPTPVKHKRAKILGSSPKSPLEGTKKRGSTKPSVENPSDVASADQSSLLLTIHKRLRERESSTLYIRNLPKKTAPAQLKSLCSGCVAIHLKPVHSIKKRTHAFVEYQSEKLALEAKKTINGKVVAGRTIKVELCSERTDKEAAGDVAHTWVAPNKRPLSDFLLTCLYVSKIPATSTVEEIRQLFPKAASFSFCPGSSKNSIGRCRVQFANKADALEAFTSQHGAVIKNCSLDVNFTLKKNRPRKNQSDMQLSSKVLPVHTSLSPNSTNSKTPNGKPKILVPKQLSGTGQMSKKNKEKSKACDTKAAQKFKKGTRADADLEQATISRRQPKLKKRKIK